jgi:hypothetical protein
VLGLVTLVVAVVAAVSLSTGGNSTAQTGSTNGSSNTGNSTATTHTTLPRPVVVSSLHQATFVDNCSTCSTENFVTGGSTNGRTLVTDIWYPSYDGNSPATGGNAPLILLAAGYDLSPLEYQPLIGAWVRAGFVVAAPVFPDTNPTAVAAVEKVYPVPGVHNPENDVANQPRDIAFVLSQLVADDRGSPGGNLTYLHSLFNPAEIGVAGQSDGGDTVAGLYFNTCCQADSTVPAEAVAILSGAEDSGWFNGTWFAGHHLPLLVTQGTKDACNSPPNAVSLYDAAPAGTPKYFLELRGADHLISYTAAGLFLTAVARTTTAFFDRYLHHGPPSHAVVLAAGATAVSSITAAPSAPALGAVPVTWTYNPGTTLDPCSINFAGPPGG